MRPYNDTKVVSLQELFHLVGTVDHDVVLFLGVPLLIGLQAEHVFVGGGIAPKQIHCHLLRRVVDLAQGYCQRSVDALNFFKLGKRCANTSMNAEDLVLELLVLDDRAKRHELKHVVNTLKDGVGVVNVFV